MKFHGRFSKIFMDKKKIHTYMSVSEVKLDKYVLND